MDFAQSYNITEGIQFCLGEIGLGIVSRSRNGYRNLTRDSGGDT